MSAIPPPFDLPRLLRDLDVPDCGCPLFQRCPECGAPHDEECIQTCRICGDEWPRAWNPATRKWEYEDRCPSCLIPGTIAAMVPSESRHDLRLRRTIKIRLECSRAKLPRPWVYPPCEHVQARDHSLTLEEWGLLMLTSNSTTFHPKDNPDTYATMPRAPKPRKVIRRQGLVALRQIRCGKYDLWRTGDLLQIEVDHVDIDSEKTANGRSPNQTKLSVRGGGKQ